jgi:tetratricopeptide (TPR) repeat protein
MSHNTFITPLVILLGSMLSFVANSAFSQSNEQTIFDRAWELYDNKDYPACLKELENLPFKEGTPGAGPYYLLGLCLYELGDYNKSIESFGRSLEIDPKMIENYYDRGYSYWANSQFKEAAADFEMSLKKNSRRKEDKTFIHQIAANYAYCLAESGNHEGAIRYLEKYPKKDATLLHVLATIVSEFQKDNHKAIMLLEEALQINPMHISSLIDLSITYSDVGNYNMAFYHIEKLIEYYPDNGHGHYLKGVYLEETGEDSDAMLCFERAEALGYVVEEE